MLYIQNLLQNIVAAHENIRAKLPNKARFGIIAFLAVISFIILIFQAEWLMANLVALLPVFYIAAVLAVGLKRALYGTAIFLFLCFALWIRVGPPYYGVPGGQSVFGGSYVLFGENDGWYNMRLVENLVHHFPVRNSFDPYTLYPYGQTIPFAPFFDWFLALIIWIAGLGHPSVALIEKIGAYFPAILGALTVIPVYFIGKELFSRNAGLLAAGLIAILPGEFLFRSLLGFTDHHIAEVLFSTTTMLFFIMAVKRAQDIRPTFGQIKRREFGNLRKPLLFALLAGFMLGIYLLSWIGGAMFAFIIFIYLAIQYVLDHLRGKSTDYLLFVGIPIFIVSLLVLSPFSSLLQYSQFVYAALIIAVFAICILSGLSLIMSRRKIKPVYYPIMIVLVGIIGAGLLYLIDKSLYHSIMNQFNYLKPNATSATIMEAQSFFAGLNISNLMDHRIWQYFTTGLFIAPIAFLTIIYSAIRREKIGKWLFIAWIGIALLTIIIDQMTSIPWWLYLTEGLIVIALYAFFEKSSARTILMLWTMVTLIALLTQTRFAYYFAINVAILSSYILWKIPDGISYVVKLTGWKEANTDRVQTRAEKRRAKSKEEQSAFRYLKPRHVSYAISTVIIFFLTVYPNLIYGTYSQNDYAYQACYQTNAASCPSCSATLFLPYHPYGPGGDWYEALTWMKNNTPEPFGDDSFYYSQYQQPAAGQTYDYPDSAYGVMSWWDYGHWITRMAHRIPNANPFQAGIGGIAPDGTIVPGASIFMTAQDEATASWVMDELDSKYVVIDYETAWPKYHTMITWSGKNQSDFYEYWYYDENDYLRTYSNPNPEWMPGAIFFYPAYYQSMCARLYNFGTEAVTPSNSSWAISYDVRTDENGEEYKILTDIANRSPFETYEQAESYINDHPEYKIVGFPDWIPAVNNIFPVKSPIPLEALKEYRKIHSSPNIMPWGDQTTSYVEIYEYTGYKK